MRASWRRCISLTVPLCPRCSGSARNRMQVRRERRSCARSTTIFSPFAPSPAARARQGAAGTMPEDRLVTASAGGGGEGGGRGGYGGLHGGGGDVLFNIRKRAEGAAGSGPPAYAPRRRKKPPPYRPET